MGGMGGSGSSGLESTGCLRGGRRIGRESLTAFPRGCYRERPADCFPIWNPATLVIAAVTMIMPYLQVSRMMGFTPSPLSILTAMLLISALYVLMSEVTKHLFFRRVSGHPQEAKA